MQISKYKFFIFLNLMILLNSFNSNYLAQIKQNSIIKKFCVQSVKEEMIKAEMAYSEEIANQKMNDLNAIDLEQATKIIAGSARSMGIEVKD